MTKCREIDLDIMRGIIILMVAYIHSNNNELATRPEWFQNIYFVFLMIMMPAFMFISGIVLSIRPKTISNLSEYLSMAAKRVNRLFIPYILFALLVFFGKLFLQQFIVLQKQVVPADFLAIILTPKSSPFGSYLWFIYVLLEYYLVVPLIQWALPKKATQICLLLGTILYFMPASDFLGLKQFCENFIFFALGMAARSNYDTYKNLIEKYFKHLATLLAISIVLVLYGGVHFVIVSLCAIPVLHQFARTPLAESFTPFIVAGKYMFPIYLMNTMFINFFKMAYGFILPFEGISFIVYTLLCVVVGATGPIFLQKTVISKTPYLRSIIR